MLEVIQIFEKSSKMIYKKKRRRRYHKMFGQSIPRCFLQLEDKML